MSQKPFGIEQGLEIYGENSDSSVRILRVTAAPGGDGGLQDAAGLGSIALRTDGQVYKKVGTANTIADWESIIAASVLHFRNDGPFRAATNDTLSAGATDPSTWSDNESGLDDTDFQVGDKILSDVNGTPVLFQVDSISSPDLTISAVVDALADEDSFVVRHYLPDSPGSQESSALLQYQDGAIVKIADVNWALADGITLNGYSESQGPITGTDTVQVAIEKTGGDVTDLVALSGVARGETDLGAFSGSTIPDDQTVKQALQALETAFEGRSQLTGVVAVAQTLDSVLVDNVKAVEWEVHIMDEAAPTAQRFEKVTAIHNGHAAADANDVDSTIHTKLKLGANFSYALAVDLSGSGAAQVARLRVTGQVGGVTFTARRTNVF